MGVKVAILTSHAQALPPQAIGAVEKLYYDLAQVWCDAGCQVTFYSVKGGEQGKNRIIRMKGFKGSGNIYLEILKDFLYSLVFWGKLQKTDIVILNSFWSPFFAPLFHWKYKKVIYGVHRFPKKQFFLYRGMDEFICVSTVVANAIKERFPYLASRVSCINNPVRTDVFSFYGQTRSRPFFTILYAGRIHPEKGLDILVDAFRLLKERERKCRLVMVGATDLSKGGGGGEYVGKLREHDCSVEILPPISDPMDLAATMKSADCFVYPSVSVTGEAFGIAPLEAMACGLPTIVSDLECFRDYGRPEENLLVFHRGPNAALELSEQIERIMADSDLARLLGQNAAETAKSFSVDRIASLYMDHFKKLMEG